METTEQLISPEKLLAQWQGHRALTRRVIVAFPEKEFFEFSIGGMRTFSQLVSEMLAIGAPAMKEMVERVANPYNEEIGPFNSKQEVLDKWDQSTEEINSYWKALAPGDFHEIFNLFGAYENTILDNIQYFIDNEIHHRGQGYVYLRALGIEPPAFWDR
jgi:uncharacterized damage-inducible protein DinB